MKPYCRYCKYKLFTKGINGIVLCAYGKAMSPVGVMLYTEASEKNKHFQCTDFKPKIWYKRRYA